MSDASTKTPKWGYSKKGDKIFDLAPGEALPDGYFAHPAQVKGSAAEEKYIEDALREDAPTPLLDEVKPEKPAKK